MTRAEARLILRDKGIANMIETCTVDHIGEEGAEALKPLMLAYIKLQKELRKRSKRK